MGLFGLYTAKNLQTLVKKEVEKKIKLSQPDWETLEREQITGSLVKSAIESIEDPKEPYRFDYSTCCEMALLDADIAACYNILKSSVLYREWRVFDKNENEVFENFNKTSTFKSLFEIAFKSWFTGHELAELVEFNQESMPIFEAYPNWLLLSPFRKCLKSKMDMPEQAVDYRDKKYENNYIDFRVNKHGHGILTPLLALAMYRSLQTWADESKSNSKIRVLKTNINNPTQKENAKTKIKGKSDWLIIGHDEEFSITSTSGDSGGNQKEFNDYLDKKIKSVLLGSNITDEKSFVGSVQYQKELLDQITESIANYICDKLNESKLLINWKILPEGSKFVCEKEGKISEDNRIKLLQNILQNYNVSDEDIEELAGIEVSGKKQIKENGNERTNIRTDKD